LKKLDTGDNKMTIDFETITQSTSKASIPTGAGINAFAHLARSAVDAKKPDTKNSSGEGKGDLIPGLPVGTADGNIKAEAKATPEELEAKANSQDGETKANVKASYG